MRHFLLSVGPSFLVGVRCGDWVRLLVENRGRISASHWPRALAISAVSLGNSVAGAVEQAVYGARIRRTTTEAPVFLLGLWRSGTTHLHRLLAVDENFAAPDLVDALLPHTFLTVGALGRTAANTLLPRSRPQDRVSMEVADAAEDEYALCADSLRSFYLAWAFPRNSPFYERFVSFDRAEPADVARWSGSMERFAQKLSFKYGRRLLLKSPNHTGRIRLLLRLFPDARFVFIHRHPFDVYRSNAHTFRSAGPFFALQHTPEGLAEERILRVCREVHDAYLRERSLVPEGRLHEISYDDVVRRPLATVRGIYDALDLPDFARTEPRLRARLEGLESYRPNRYTDLPTDVRDRVLDAWAPMFDTWGYPRDTIGAQEPEIDR